MDDEKFTGIICQKKREEEKGAAWCCSLEWFAKALLKVLITSNRCVLPLYKVENVHKLGLLQAVATATLLKLQPDLAVS